MKTIVLPDAEDLDTSDTFYRYQIVFSRDVSIHESGAFMVETRTPPDKIDGKFDYLWDKLNNLDLLDRDGDERDESRHTVEVVSQAKVTLRCPKTMEMDFNTPQGVDT